MSFPPKQNKGAIAPKAPGKKMNTAAVSAALKKRKTQPIEPPDADETIEKGGYSKAHGVGT